MIQKSQPDKHCCTQCHGSSSLFFLYEASTLHYLCTSFRTVTNLSVDIAEWYSWGFTQKQSYQTTWKHNYCASPAGFSDCTDYNKDQFFRHKKGKGNELEIRGKVEFWIFCLLKISFTLCKKMLSDCHLIYRKKQDM